MNSAAKHLNKLKSSGYRTTKLRTTLLNLLEASPAALTASNIINSAMIKALHPNKTTIYRELEKLLSEDIVEEVAAGDRAKSYKLSPQTHHHHLICKSCKKIECIESEKLENALTLTVKEISLNKKFLIDSHELVFLGLCQGCKV